MGTSQAAEAVVQPHRGYLILTLGFLGIPLPVLSIIACAMGNYDLKEMAAGRMDRHGEANTKTGMVIGQWTLLVYGGLLILKVLGHF